MLRIANRHRKGLGMNEWEQCISGWSERNVKLQQQVETLRAQVKQLDRTLADVYAQRDGLQRELVASKAENSRLVGIAEQQRELRESGEVYLDDVKAQLGQVQRVRDEFEGERDQLHAAFVGAKAELSQLQALVRAFFSARASNDQEAYTRTYIDLKRILDATIPAPRQKQVHLCEIPGCGSCANPEGGDGE